jgi:outer membrane protein assembly factor BamA
VAASNLEYRFPIAHGVVGAAFFDSGSGLLLPNWLGPTRPALIDPASAVLHASTGFEARWTLPGMGVPLRVNYSFNVLRLNRAFLLPDGSVFRVRNRLGAFGWGFGSLF